ncbi:hypothetical protein L1049_015392 [Liquidambar formosana]|uniref:RRM domain-containing protein n=1 Tax=Liquidambar formosana TaxID=63359 RepID=A0AAP0S457_LIQFO
MVDYWRGRSSGRRGRNSCRYGRSIQRGRDEGCVTLFVDNLPDRMENRWLRSMFKWYGDIADVFVPWKKRTGSNSRYGFVRFYNDKDAEVAIQRCNGAWCWNKRLLVKRAMYSKTRKETYKRHAIPKRPVWRRKESSIDPVKALQEEIPNPYVRTYADVLVGRNSTNGMAEQQTGNTTKHQHPVIETIQVEEVDNDWVKRCVIGSVIHFSYLQGLQEAFSREGVFDITVRYMGGLLVLLEFHLEEIMKSHLKDGTWLAQWVKDIRSWHPNLLVHERLVWLSIVGVPLHAWLEINFMKIGEKFGEVISIDGNTHNRKMLDRGRILVSTKLLEPISKELILEVCNENFLITVREELVTDPKLEVSSC